MPSSQGWGGLGRRGETVPDTVPVSQRRVVVVDDHCTFAELLTMGLEAHPRLTCVGSASDVRSALDLVAREQPDVVVMDIRLGTESGVEVTAQIIERWPDMAVVVLTAYPTPKLMTDVVHAGASALLPKDGALDDLLDTVLSARPRMFSMPPRLAESMMRPRDGEPISPLTPREMEVLRQLAMGRDVRGISRELGISVNTCRSYVKSLLAKLDVHSQLEAVVAAHERGLLDTDSTG